MNIKITNTTGKGTQIVGETFFEGIGLHTSKKSTVIIKNNPKRDGIIFKYGKIVKKIRPEILDTKEKTTSIIHNNKPFIICIEHLMSALYGLGIANAFIEVKGGREIPILAGNSYSFIEKLILNIVVVRVKKRFIKIVKPIIIVDDNDKNRYIRLLPSKNTFLKIKSYVSYTDSCTRSQKFIFNFLNSRAYIKEISHAKTSFPFKITTKEKLIQVQKRLKGAIIEGKNRNINIYSSENISKTYYINEIARHKILDFLGDIRTIGMDLAETDIELHKTGHNLNIKLARLIRDKLDNSGH